MSKPIVLRDHSQPCEHVERMRGLYEEAFGLIRDDELIRCPWSVLCPGGRVVKAKQVAGETLLVDEYYWVLGEGDQR